MRSLIIGLIIFCVGWGGGAWFVRWQISELFAGPEGRAACEAVLSGAR
jgi:hypothetical protein